MMLMEKSCRTAETQVTGAPDEDEAVLEERRGNSTERLEANFQNWAILIKIVKMMYVYQYQNMYILLCNNKSF